MSVYVHSGSSKVFETAADAGRDAGPDDRVAVYPNQGGDPYALLGSEIAEFEDSKKEWNRSWRRGTKARARKYPNEQREIREW